MGRRNNQKTKLIKIIAAFMLTCLVLWTGAQSTADAEMVSGGASQNSVEEVLSVEDPALTNDDAETEQLIDGGVQENEGIDVGWNALVESDESTSQESSDQSGNETAVGNQREDEPVEEEPVASATSPSTDLQLTRTQDVTLDAASSDIRYATGIFTGELQDATTALGVEMAIIDGVSHDVVDDASVLSKLAAIQQAIVYDEISNRVVFELKSGTITRIDALDWSVNHVFDISAFPSSFVYENGSYDRDLIVLKLSSGTTINGGDESRVFTRSELLKLNERYGSITVSLDNDRLYFDANKKQTVTLDEVSLSLGTVREYSIDVKLKDGYVPQEPECKIQIACESKYGTELTYSRNTYGFIKVNNIDKQREAAAQRAKEMTINKDAQKAASTLNGMDVANSMQLTLDSYLNEFLTPAQKRELERYLIVYYTDVIESLRFAPGDFTSELQRKVMNKILGKLGVSINQYFFFGNTTAECKVEFESAKYGAVVVELKTVFSNISMDAHSNPYASFGKIDYKVLVDDKSLVKGKTTEGMGVASFASLETFGKQVRSVAYSSLKGAYGGIWKSDASKVASVFIDSTMGRYMAGEFASGVYKLVTKPVDYYVNSNALSTQAELETMSDDAGEGTSVSSYKKIVLPQEVDIDVYDWDGELCGSLHDGKVTPGNGEAPIVTGSSYANGSSSASPNCVYLTVNDYVVNISAKSDCRATLVVEEYENGELARSVEASDLQLLAGKQYYCLVLAGVGTGTEEYSLVSEDGDILECDSEYLPNDPDGFFSAPLYAEGSCGENVTNRFYAGSSLDPRSTLVISGNGPMKNYDQNNLKAPYVFSIAHNIVIEDGVTSVGTCSFGARNTTWAGSTYVENVVLADSVKTIGDRAFWKSDLSYIHIGKGCEHVSSAAFCYTPNLYALEVDEENDYLKSVNGVLFTKDGSRLIRYHHRSEDSYTIPDDVLFIDEDAFGDCVDLSSVEIPDSVISMPGEVFDGCSGLESISIHAQEVDLGRGLGALSSSPTIYAYSGSDAQAYAEQNDLSFVSLGTAPSTAKKRAYAILYKNGHLVLQRGLEIDLSEGAVEATFTGFEAHSSCPWENVSSKVKSVIIKDKIIPLHFYKWFSGMTNCVSIDLRNLDAKWITSMNEMFSGCSSLEHLDASGLNTRSVRSMSSMFSNCSSLVSLDLIGFDTSSVTDMSSMFRGCRQLTNLNISAFDTSHVSNVAAMFKDCSSLEHLDVANFVTRSFRDLSYMFSGCSSLKQLEITGFDTSSVTNMGGLFYDCSSLESIDLHNFDTSSVGNMRCMFSGCASLRSLDFSSFDTSNVTDMNYMFSGTGKLETIVFPSRFKLSDGGSDLSGYWTHNGGTEYSVADMVKLSQEGNLEGIWVRKLAEDTDPDPIEEVVTGITSIFAPSSALPESRHDYENNLDWRWKYYDSTARHGFAVEFSQDTVVEEDYDFIYLYDAGGNLIGMYTGDELAGKTIVIPHGSSFTIRLISDESESDYGFRVVRITEAHTGNMFDISLATIQPFSPITYNGKAQTPLPVVAVGGKSLRVGTDYTVSYRNNVNAGTATVTITGKGNFAGTKTATYAIVKAANGMSTTAKKKGVTLKSSKLKKKAQTVKASKLATVRGYQGKVTYKLKGVTAKKYKKYFKVSSGGKVTVKKGLKKGAYRLKVAVTAAGDANHEAATRTITCKVVVK